ncbi:hypothetical protein [Corynebacterium ulcerans]|nr:hypothetical protein [Corynebacterium ulcerans]
MITKPHDSLSALKDALKLVSPSRRCPNKDPLAITAAAPQQA